MCGIKVEFIYAGFVNQVPFVTSLAEKKKAILNIEFLDLNQKKNFKFKITLKVNLFNFLFKLELKITIYSTRSILSLYRE